VPVAQFFDDHLPAGEFGRRCKIVDGDRSTEIRLIERISPELFWQIPQGRDEVPPPPNLAPVHIPPVGYARVPVAKRPTYGQSGQRALAEEQVDSSDDDVENNENAAPIADEPDQRGGNDGDEAGDNDGSDEPSWGANWSDCKEQSFAVTYHTTDSGTNLNVIKIRQIYEQDGKNSFKGLPYVCSEFQNDEACLTATWHGVRGARFDESLASRWYDYNVISYFTAWKKDKNGKKLKQNLLSDDVVQQIRHSGLQFHVRSNAYDYSDSEHDAD
jgi:hypothetical protein